MSLRKYTHYARLSKRPEQEFCPLCGGKLWINEITGGGRSYYCSKCKDVTQAVLQQQTGPIERQSNPNATHVMHSSSHGVLKFFGLALIVICIPIALVGFDLLIYGSEYTWPGQPVSDRLQGLQLLGVAGAFFLIGMLLNSAATKSAKK